MNILVIDTATEACSAALQIGERQWHRFEICPQQHSQRLLPMVDELLKEAGATLKDLDGLAYGRGPGSFTGVRIATGMIQGLALGTGLPVVGISTLAAMAQQAHSELGATEVVAAIDARMDEVYLGCYHFDNGQIDLRYPEQVLPPQDAASLIDELPVAPTGVGTGWAAYAALNPKAWVKVTDNILYPSALFMLPLARQQLQQGAGSAVEDIEPVYLRDQVTWKKLPGRE
ncbi:tRNA (adenosine(37)-N6)-threonylcarbamoyltransferase complex dimerization subunit type 1 TsaB [Aliiglaciecola sp. CAU 1673]|uniref:tRNA (adenosine(37)-N6)-threonylcarbamoyltransferase complex dimerization subunit type 1 TsaB n=1 Tax=Aliiglaciecola sp. CAU 1673 TaxID=3032595 RepID=UPI0023DB5317|nr:tRNA (adenosine(37)-N6)-threonylcarbamoyltransferase complex dimerization subunit type 1 TsaB [Aliiglaciecola sp. CAU 1673]MDF2179837.1 tRNA (adenosine(37)-N6)-threonylcarbamoyltransferase complex dimerization subunit type 1 TsaB [Aliiglaciecola sp. CAU 1673]